MEHLISCEFNMDTACVELIFANDSMIAIDTIAVENEVADNMYQRSELDWLIYTTRKFALDVNFNTDTCYNDSGRCTICLEWYLTKKLFR